MSYLMLPHEVRRRGINGEERRKKNNLPLCPRALHLAGAPSLLDFAISPSSLLARVCKLGSLYVFFPVVAVPSVTPVRITDIL